MIRLPYPPVVSVQQMRSVNPDGSILTMLPDRDFVLDRISEPPRIFPLPGEYWPPDLYVANALEIDFTAGYDADPTAVDAHLASPPNSGGVPGQQPDSTIVTGIPQMMVLAIMNLTAYWWNNRGQMGVMPDDILRIFQHNMVVNWAPTRG